MIKLSEKKKINGGELLLRCLHEESVTRLFGITGGQLITIYDAVHRWGREKGMDTVMVRHEQAAAHAADAWARVSNTPGVCMGTVGPGATHLVPGIGAAWSDNIPVIAIVPQVRSRDYDKFSLQGGLDQVTMFKPITKYQISVRKIEEIPDAVRKCFREATGGRPGPVLLEIYEDALIAEIEEESSPILSRNQYRAIKKPAVDKILIKDALDLLINAEKPLIVSGGGVSRAEAWNELQEFAEYLQIPVLTSIMGMGTISSQSKCHIGISRGPLSLNSEADVVLSLGCKFSHIMGYGEEPLWNNSQKLIQVDIDPGMIGRNKPVTLGIVGDCKSFLTQILDEVKKLERIEKREWLEKLNEAVNEQQKARREAASSESIPIAPERMVKEVFEFMDDDSILIIDGGNIAGSAFRQVSTYKDRKPLSVLAQPIMGHLGTSIPYGIGAKLAKPEKQVVSISGDGSFIMNIQDLETAVRLGLKNLIFVVGNNSAWGMIKDIQRKWLGERYIDTDIPDFDFGRCAESFGCYGEEVTDPNEIKNALERAKNTNKPAVIDVKIKY